MSDGSFWVTVEPFGRLEPHFPRNARGRPRVDDRRMISGIVHVLKSGGRWADAPPVYGPCKALHNRFVRWAAKGVWENIFHVLAAAGGAPAQVMTDAPTVRQAAAKGGADPGHRAVARWANHQNPRPERSARSAARLLADRRSGCRRHRRRPSARPDACHRSPAR